MTKNKYLINPDTFLSFEDLSVNIDPQRILTYAKKGQELDLKPFLGHAFYDDLLKQFEAGENGISFLSETASEAYQKLWNGCDYTDPHGHSITYEGMIPTLVYFAFARFVEGGSISFTPAGPGTAKSDYFNSLSLKDINTLVSQYRSEANAHCNEVQKYLEDNRKDFPLWNFNAANKRSRQPGARISGIDRTAYNYPGTTNFNYNPNELLGWQ